MLELNCGKMFEHKVNFFMLIEREMPRNQLDLVTSIIDPECYIM